MARRRSTSRTRRRRPGAAPPPAALPRVRVRMYRQGLGDCLLVTFGEGDAARHMLIDCGTLGTRATPDNTMARVAAHIREETQDRLTVLVATHEHKDHVSGFRSSLWSGVRAEHVWLAWTENPECRLAQELAVFRDDLRAALVASLGAATMRGASAGLAAHDLLGFSGDPDALGADDFAETVDRAMKLVRDGFGAAPTYLKPRKPPLELPEIPGFRFYVLGPPHDRRALEDLGAHHSPHLYGLRAAAATAGAVSGARGALSAAEAEDADLQMPFDCRHRFRQERVLGSWYPSYYAADSAWRQIDGEWLSAAADLALQLDSFTNNTSLALAIERIADRRVLLFPADAQQGNWLSWNDNDQWTVPDPMGTPRRVTAHDLLAHTVFYKVGHHGSHNATAKDDGLERMKSGELTAFIPVDRAVALDRSPKGTWKMPARPLYRRLLERCNGRVARSDLGWAAAPAAGTTEGDVEGDFLGMASDAEWERWRSAQTAAVDGDRVRIDPLFVEFTLR